MRERSYLCARSAAVCPLRIACWFGDKCVLGGPYFKKVGDTYLEEWDIKPGDAQPVPNGGGSRPQTESRPVIPMPLYR